MYLILDYYYLQNSANRIAEVVVIATNVQNAITALLLRVGLVFTAEVTANTAMFVKIMALSVFLYVASAVDFAPNHSTRL